MAEFVGLVEEALKGQIDQITLRELAAIQTHLNQTQEQITRWFDSGEVTPHQYLELLNSALRAAMEQSRILLGHDRFHAVFGEAGDHPESLVNETTFVEYAISEAKGRTS